MPAGKCFFNGHPRPAAAGAAPTCEAPTVTDASRSFWSLSLFLCCRGQPRELVLHGRDLGCSGFTHSHTHPHVYDAPTLDTRSGTAGSQRAEATQPERGAAVTRHVPTGGRGASANAPWQRDHREAALANPPALAKAFC